jgi:beta-glucosidase
MHTKASLITNYDEEKNDWNIEAGDFMLQPGNSAGYISQKLKIAVK